MRLRSKKLTVLINSYSLLRREENFVFIQNGRLTIFVSVSKGALRLWEQLLFIRKMRHKKALQTMLEGFRIPFEEKKEMKLRRKKNRMTRTICCFSRFIRNYYNCSEYNMLCHKQEMEYNYIVCSGCGNIFICVGRRHF